MSTPQDGVQVAAPATLEGLWTRLLEVSGSNRRIRALLDAAAPVSWKDGELAVFVPANVVGSFRAYRGEIDAMAARAACGAVCVRVEAPEVSLLDAPPPITDHPLVKQAMEVLNAKVVSVQPRAKRSQTV